MAQGLKSKLREARTDAAKAAKAHDEMALLLRAIVWQGDGKLTIPNTTFKSMMEAEEKLSRVTLTPDGDDLVLKNREWTDNNEGACESDGTVDPDPEAEAGGEGGEPVPAEGAGDGEQGNDPVDRSEG